MPQSITGQRQKIIHSVGTVAKVKLTDIVDGSHPFTGAFKSGTDYGLARISFAGKPDPKIKYTTPGMALKFFRDGIQSASLVAMFSVEG